MSDKTANLPPPLSFTESKREEVKANVTPSFSFLPFMNTKIPDGIEKETEKDIPSRPMNQSHKSTLLPPPGLGSNHATYTRAQTESISPSDVNFRHLSEEVCFLAHQQIPAISKLDETVKLPSPPRKLSTENKKKKVKASPSSRTPALHINTTYEEANVLGKGKKSRSHLKSSSSSSTLSTKLQSVSNPPTYTENPSISEERFDEDKEEMISMLIELSRLTRSSAIVTLVSADPCWDISAALELFFVRTRPSLGVIPSKVQPTEKADLEVEEVAPSVKSKSSKAGGVKRSGLVKCKYELKGVGNCGFGDKCRFLH
jgi:hypothetical protein